MKTLALLLAFLPLGTAHASPQFPDDPIQHADHLAPEPDVIDLQAPLPSQDASATQHLLMVDTSATAFVLDELTGQAAIGVGGAHDASESNGCAAGDLPRLAALPARMVSTNPGPGGPVGSPLPRTKPTSIAPNTAPQLALIGVDGCLPSRDRPQSPS